MTTTKKPGGKRRKAREVWLHRSDNYWQDICWYRLAGRRDCPKEWLHVRMREILPAPKRGGRKG